MAEKISKEKLYNIWASDYDKWPNVRMVLEEQNLPKLIDNVKNKRILDLGCGTGRWSVRLAKEGAIVTAVDESDSMLKKLKEKIRKERLDITVIRSEISKIKLKEKFDVILMSFVESHISNLKPIFRLVKNYLNKGGIFIISSTIYFPDIKKRAKEEILILENKYQLPFYVHPEEEMRELAREFDFNITIKKIFVGESVKYLFEQKPHKPFSENKGKHFVTIYKFRKNTPSGN